MLEYIAGDHILRIKQARHVESYLLDVLKSGENTGQSKYEEWESDLDCGIYADLYYRRFSFWAGDTSVRLEQPPTEPEIVKKADELR